MSGSCALMVCLVVSVAVLATACQTGRTPAIGAPAWEVVGCDGPTCDFGWLRACLEYDVEGRLAHPAEPAEPGAGDDVADAGLAGLRAQREPDVLGQRGRG